jgi:glutamine synthetase
MEQHEVELLPQNLTRMAEAITITKWVIRNVCANHGIFVSFSPKLSLEHAGNGMHLHLCGLKEGKNIIADSGGGLADEARHIVGGILKFAPSLTAFGNTVPASYLRFISRKESPMHICWGAKNRLALVRIPLWWDFKGFKEADGCRRTFEFRAPDSTANSYLLFAGIAVAAEYGLRNSKEAAEIAFDLNADSKVKESKKRKALPLSCAEAADNLRRDREYYEAGDVFPTRVIDGMIGRLKAHKDEGVWERLADEPNKVEELLLEYMHCG